MKSLLIIIIVLIIIIHTTLINPAEGSIFKVLSPKFLNKASSSAPGSSSPSAASSKPGSGKSLILFGATGFVGSKIGEIAHARGWNIFATSRTGGPKRGSYLDTVPWREEATWVKLDANERKEVHAFLEDVAGGKAATDSGSSSSSSTPPVTAIVNSIGKIGFDHPVVCRDNKQSVLNTVAAIREGKAPESLKQYVYISAADSMAVVKPFLRGYYHGKQESEKALQEHLPSSVPHTILRPGLIYGPRWASGVKVPTPIGRPLEVGLSPISQYFPCTRGVTPAPPISVKDVAKAAVYSSEAGASPELGKSGIYEYAGIKDLAKRLT